MPDGSRPAALADIRVLDLSTPLAEATGRVFADLGAEVIKVEPPGGCASRFVPPFAGGRQTARGDPDGSLFWRALGLGKRSVVLDLTTEPTATLSRWSWPPTCSSSRRCPGEMAALGLGYDSLAALNPTLVYVSVTPFGQTGPEATSAGDRSDPVGRRRALELPGRRRPTAGADRAARDGAHGAVQAAADVILALYGARSRRAGPASRHLAAGRRGLDAAVRGRLSGR